MYYILLYLFITHTMKKIITLSALVMMSLILVGCFSKKTDDDTVTSTGTVDTPVTLQQDTPTISGEFAVSSCNAYVNLMGCVIEKTDPSIQDQQKKSFEDLLVLWRSLTPDQLVQACDMNMQVVQQQKELIEKMGCTL